MGVAALRRRPPPFLLEHSAQWHLLGLAFVLSAVYLVIGFQVFLWFFRSSRRAGSLLTQGE